MQGLEISWLMLDRASKDVSDKKSFCLVTLKKVGFGNLQAISV